MRRTGPGRARRRRESLGARYGGGAKQKRSGKKKGSKKSIFFASFCAPRCCFLCRRRVSAWTYLRFILGEQGTRRRKERIRSSGEGGPRASKIFFFSIALSLLFCFTSLAPPARAPPSAQIHDFSPGQKALWWTTSRAWWQGRPPRRPVSKMRRVRVFRRGRHSSSS